MYPCVTHKPEMADDKKPKSLKQQIKELANMPDDDPRNVAIEKPKRATRKAKEPESHALVPYEAKKTPHIPIPTDDKPEKAEKAEKPPRVARIARKPRKAKDPTKPVTKVAANEGYCVRCKTSKQMKNPHEELIKNKNGREMRALKGNCVTCDAKMTRFLGAKAE